MNESTTIPPARRWLGRWREGKADDVSAFLHDEGELSLGQVVAVLLVELRERRQSGECVRAETLLERFPHLADQSEYVVELIYGEYLLRRELGEDVNLTEYQERFPTYAEALALQIGLNRALQGELSNEDDTRTVDDANRTTPPREGTTPPVDATPPRRVGSLPRLDGYEMLGELGKGGMGAVYRARHLALGRLVAVKMILSGSLADDHAVRRFRAEAEAVARLDHPGIVPVFEVGEQDGTHFFSMALVGGGSLAGRVHAEGPLPQEKAAQLTRDIAQAVAYAHERGIVHRDLKPANILLDVEDRPRVTDFGLAKQTGGDAELTGTGQVMGTPAYMPPEQARGEKDVGPLADVYSLGAILYHLLVGRPPFQAASVMETLRLVLENDPVSPRQFAPSLSRDLETICLKCLAKEPARRYESATHLADDLGRYLAGEPILARPVGRIERAVKWARRRPAVAAMSTAVVIVTAVALVAISLALVQTREALGDARRARGEAESSEQQAQRNLYDARLFPLTQSWQDGDFARARLLLEETKPAPGKPDPRGWEWYYFLAQVKAAATSYSGTSPYTGPIAWCPQTSQLALGNEASTIDILDGEDYRLLKTLPSAGGVRIVRLSWQPEGKQLACACDDEKLRIWDVEQGRILRVLPDWRTANERAMSWSPDGKLLASGGNGGRINLWNAENWKLIRTFGPWTDSAHMLGFAWHADGRRLAAASRWGAYVIWDVQQGKPLVVRQTGTGGWTFSVAWRSDFTRLAVGAGADMADRPSLTLWDQESKLLAQHVEGMEQFVSVCWNPGDTMLAACQIDGTIRLFTADDLRPRQRVRVTNYPARPELVWQQDSDRLLLAAGQLHVVHQPGRSRKSMRLLVPQGKMVFTVRYSPDGRWLAASISGDNRREDRRTFAGDPIVIWDARTDEVARRLDYKHLMVTSVTWSPDSERLAFADSDGMVNVRDRATGAVIWNEASAGFHSAVRLAWSPDGRRIANAGPHHIHVLDARNGKREVVLGSEDARYIDEVSWSPDGRYLTAAGLLWATDGWRPPVPLATERIHRVGWSPDSQTVILATSRGWIERLNLQTRERSATQPAHSGSFAVAWSPDGRRFATGGPDSLVKIWDPATLQALVTLPVDQPVTTLDWSPDGRSLAVGDGVGSVQVLRADDSMPAAIKPISAP